MDFTMGMRCPGCKKENKFLGGCIGGSITQVNYNCECGFSAILLVPTKGYDIEYRGIKKDAPAEIAEASVN